MKLALLVALSLCTVGVALAATPSALACTPPNCPGFGACHVTYTVIANNLGLPDVYVPTGIECYY